jgi:16S rRNA (guanine966-N2)-methyltransferase
MSIRVHQGIYKNRQLLLPTSSSTVRPTKSNVNRILFDILRPILPKNFSFMDVCAGYGTVGINALSAGAGLVVFCDNDKRCLDCIKKNLSLMPLLLGRTMFINKSVVKMNVKGRALNVIYLDPPYASYVIVPKVIKKLLANEWIDSNTIVVLETHRSVKVAVNDFIIIRERVVGNSKLVFLKYIPENVISHATYISTDAALSPE